MLMVWIGLLGFWAFFFGALTEGNKTFNLIQHDYQINFEWGEIVRYDKQYVNQFSAIVFKYNRTCAAANLTYMYKIDVGNELEVIVQAYKFASNEYRLFPLRFEVNFCDSVARNLVGSRRIFNCGNFTGCPLRKQIRNHICNWTPDQTQFPPFIPSGKYKLQLQGLYRSKELWVGDGYGSVSRPIVKK